MVRTKKVIHMSWIVLRKTSGVFTMNVMVIALAKIPEREGSISPFSFYGQLPDY